MSPPADCFYEVARIANVSSLRVGREARQCLFLELSVNFELSFGGHDDVRAVALYDGNLQYSQEEPNSW
jgi:hypothetical protein